MELGQRQNVLVGFDAGGKITGIDFVRVAITAAVLATAACSEMMNTPTAQSVAGLPPSGSVTITEDFVAGLGGGKGTLQYQGRSYPFKVLGSVAGPGGGVEKISASGPVYKLASVADFPVLLVIMVLRICSSDSRAVAGNLIRIV